MKHPVIRHLRYVAVLLGVVGLAFLYLMVIHRDFPVVKVSEITPMMNFAYVRITGTVERNAYIGRKKGKVDYLSFSLDDGSGQVRVTAYRDIAQGLVEKGLAPTKGTLVDVSGSLSVPADGNVKLRLQAEEQMKIINRKRDTGRREDA